MAQDLMDRNLLTGKSRVEVRDLLGAPDECGVDTNQTIATAATVVCGDPKEDWYAYKVITIARCRFWECLLQVSFDEHTYRVTSVAVSD